ncbi:helix-turn-helix domain-containing protein [Williamsia sp. M5A3_1d]
MSSTGDGLREFLTSRRARLTPVEAGLPDFGGRRRVPGLRREEVAMLAGMSTEYYVRLERGNATGVSESILDGIGRALHLDAAEYAHLCDLVRSANEGASARRRRRNAQRPQQIRPGVQQMIDAMTHVPVVVQNGRLEVVATNQLGTALFAPMFDASHRPANFARYVFLDPGAERFYRDWHDSAEQLVTVLRGEAGRAPYDRALTDLIGELSTRSDVFRTLWAAHDVRNHETGVKRIHHPVVGDIELNYEAMEVLSTPGTQLVAFSAAPATTSSEALSLLASWATPAIHTGITPVETPDEHSDA